MTIKIFLDVKSIEIQVVLRNTSTHVWASPYESRLNLLISGRQILLNLRYVIEGKSFKRDFMREPQNKGPSQNLDFGIFISIRKAII